MAPEPLAQALRQSYPGLSALSDADVLSELKDSQSAVRRSEAMYEIYAWGLVWLAGAFGLAAYWSKTSIPAFLLLLVLLGLFVVVRTRSVYGRALQAELHRRHGTPPAQAGAGESAA